jgi:hypothetical protein
MMIRKVSGQSLCSPCILNIPFRVAGYPETNELLMGWSAAFTQRAAGV